MDFIDARHTARMTRKEVSEYLQLTLRTINRYEESGKAPKAVIECLLMIGGYCPTFSLKNDFTGWSFGSGFLHSNSGYKFTSGDILAGRSALIESNRLWRLKRRVMVLHDSDCKIIPFPVDLLKKVSL